MLSRPRLRKVRIRRIDRLWEDCRTRMWKLYYGVRPRLRDGSDLRLSSLMNGVFRHRLFSHGRLPKEAKRSNSDLLVARRFVTVSCCVRWG